MFYLTATMYRVGARAATNAMETHCPVCGEALSYNPPNDIGECSCGYNTED